MKKSRFSDSQIISIPKQAEAGTPVAAASRRYPFVPREAFENSAPAV